MAALGNDSLPHDGTGGVMKVGFIGLGGLGLPIARLLLQAGPTVVVYNRTRSLAEALQPLPPTLAVYPSTAARGARVVYILCWLHLVHDGVNSGAFPTLHALGR